MTNRLKTNGFTIVELLIVVVVIAILAAITVVAYNGVTQQSRSAARGSEMKTAVKKLETDKIQSGTGHYTSTEPELLSTLRPLAANPADLYYYSPAPNAVAMIEDPLVAYVTLTDQPKFCFAVLDMDGNRLLWATEAGQFSKPLSQVSEDDEVCRVESSPFSYSYINVGSPYPSLGVTNIDM